jgi:hypothetical protein
MPPPPPSQSNLLPPLPLALSCRLCPVASLADATRRCLRPADAHDKPSHLLRPGRLPGLHHPLSLSHCPAPAPPLSSWRRGQAATLGPPPLMSPAAARPGLASPSPCSASSRCRQPPPGPTRPPAACAWLVLDAAARHPWPLLWLAPDTAWISPPAV